MSVGQNHVPIDRLTALAFVARGPEDDQDQHALAHIARCVRCADELARLTIDADALRDVAFANADALFDDVKLDAQRSRILDRLANLGHAARVLRFPRNNRDIAMPVSTGGGRRWISVAAAAGLIIGLLGGQLLHFVSWDTTARRENTLSLQSPARQHNPSIVPAGSSVQTVSDEEFLDQVEDAVQLRRAHSLRALDALTPSAGNFRDLRLGR
ncbi:MAG TPA: hypothetical protein VNJ02_18115 [Vicinamibacterales bacterium]|nr:hypothetical protein [Vicinamibacterales bacterium]